LAAVIDGDGRGDRQALGRRAQQLIQIVHLAPEVNRAVGLSGGGAGRTDDLAAVVDPRGRCPRRERAAEGA
jgi:hypothetical protein